MAKKVEFGYTPGGKKKGSSFKKKFFMATAYGLAGTTVLWGTANYYGDLMGKNIDKEIADSFMETTGEYLKWDNISARANQLFADPESQAELYSGAPDITLLGEAAEQDNFADFSDRWYSAMGRYESFMQNPKNSSFMKGWYKQLDDLKGKPLAEMANGVDALVDKLIEYKYDHDDEGYDKADYWASPIETANNKFGDCDDFAILKYFALKYLDVPADNMYVVIVGSDGGQLDHATLMVDVAEHGAISEVLAAAGLKKLDPEFVILDNDGSETGRLIEEDRSQFKPYYAMNEKGVWSVSKKNSFW